MADSLRSDGARTIGSGSDRDRDAKIEQLLLAGLDHYFAARYEQAIDVWTRALFFDRGHPRARAYIERARSALAEQQRESEARSHDAALGQRQIAAAEVLALPTLDDDLPAPFPDDQDDEFAVSSARRGRLRLPTPRFLLDDAPTADVLRTRPVIATWALVVVVIALAGGVYAVATERIDLLALVGGQDAESPFPNSPAVGETELMLPRRGDTAIARARLLAREGRLHDALSVLETVRVTDALRPEADRVQEAVQRQLLGQATPASEAVLGEPGGQPPPMKCPKCGYLGFEEVSRCRNCSYEFSLAQHLPVPELALNDRDAPEHGAIDSQGLVKDRSVSSSAGPSSDLPLFGAKRDDDQPLITKASPPRTPLAVRRATPEMPRHRVERNDSFDLSFDADMPPPRSADDFGASRADTPSDVLHRDAGLGARFVAAAIDIAILAVVDVLVVYFTLKICGVTWPEWDRLPLGPLLAFLLVENGGYLVGFTAGGQTLGKLAVGIRVIAADATEPVDVGRALRRTLIWLLLAIPAGLGFLTAFLTSDRRGLHDRLAGTRVVRASA